MSNEHRTLTATCRCGEVGIEAIGRPIVSATCYCRSCQEAGRQLHGLPGGTAVVGPDGGTGYVLFRRDRVRSVKGREKLGEHRLAADSPTRRVLATCCNTPMFLDFTKGHWITFYRDRLPAGVAPVEMRVMTRDRPSGTELSGDVPSYAGHSGRFMWRLLAARLAMGFHTPKAGL